MHILYTQCCQPCSRPTQTHASSGDPWTLLLAESEKELKGFLMKVQEESEKVCLNLNIRKTKIMASGPITLWKLEGETVEIVTDFTYLFIWLQNHRRW